MNNIKKEIKPVNIPIVRCPKTLIYLYGLLLLVLVFCLIHSNNNNMQYEGLKINQRKKMAKRRNII